MKSIGLQNGDAIHTFNNKDLPQKYFKVQYDLDILSNWPLLLEVDRDGEGLQSSLVRKLMRELEWRIGKASSE